jgi:hypothetical protein
MYFQITGDHKTGIDFNHLANKLVFQYSKLVEEPPKEEEQVDVSEPESSTEIKDAQA